MIRQRAEETAPDPRRGELTKPVRIAVVDLVALGLDRLMSRPLRAVLSALGISIGIATMVVVTGIPASSQQAVLDELSALGPDLLQAAALPDDTTQSPAAMPTSALAMARRIGPVSDAGAVANVHAIVERNDRLGSDATAGGITTLASSVNLPRLLDAHATSGTLLSEANARFPVVVLGSQAAVWLGITTLPAGQPLPRILLNDTWFTVVGVLSPTPLAEDIEQSVLVGWEAARSVLDFDGVPTVVYLRADETQVESVQAVLARTLNPENPGRVQVSRPSAVLRAKRITSDAFSTLFLGLAGVALLVGGIGVANTMVISVLERRREIGMRRALGATRRQVRSQFLAESIVLCLVGGAAGTAIGVGGVIGYARLQGWPAVLSVTAVLTGLGASLLLGVLAGVYPAVRASRLSPTEALAGD